MFWIGEKCIFSINGTCEYAIISINTRYILNNVVQEPLLKNNSKYKCYFFKHSFIMNSYILFIIIIIYLINDFVLALKFILQKEVQDLIIPNTIGCRRF